MGPQRADNYFSLAVNVADNFTYFIQDRVAVCDVRAKLFVSFISLAGKIICTTDRIKPETPVSSKKKKNFEFPEFHTF